MYPGNILYTIPCVDIGRPVVVLLPHQSRKNRGRSRDQSGPKSEQRTSKRRKTKPDFPVMRNCVCGTHPTSNRTHDTNNQTRTSTVYDVHQHRTQFPVETCEHSRYTSDCTSTPPTTTRREPNSTTACGSCSHCDGNHRTRTSKQVNKLCQRCFAAAYERCLRQPHRLAKVEEKLRRQLQLNAKRDVVDVSAGRPRTIVSTLRGLRSEVKKSTNAIRTSRHITYDAVYALLQMHKASQNGQGFADYEPTNPTNATYSSWPGDYICAENSDCTRIDRSVRNPDSDHCLVYADHPNTTSFQFRKSGDAVQT